MQAGLVCEDMLKDLTGLSQYVWGQAAHGRNYRKVDCQRCQIDRRGSQPHPACFIQYEGWSLCLIRGMHIWLSIEWGEAPFVLCCV